MIKAIGLYDWHLPSRDELNQMYVNLHQQGVGGFASDGYWSSSESSANGAWLQHFGAGSHGIGSKDFSGCVRAVRALPFAGDLYEVYPEDAPEMMTWGEAMDWCKDLN